MSQRKRATLGKTSRGADHPNTCPYKGGRKRDTRHGGPPPPPGVPEPGPEAPPPAAEVPAERAGRADPASPTAVMTAAPPPFTTSPSPVRPRGGGSSAAL